MIKEEEIENAFKGTSFGENPNHKKIIVDTLLKLNVGFGTGRTATMICFELGLLNSKKKPNTKGFAFMREHYDLMTVK
jgi:hypothetical protein